MLLIIGYVVIIIMSLLTVGMANVVFRWKHEQPKIEATRARGIEFLIFVVFLSATLSLIYFVGGYQNALGAG